MDETTLIKQAQQGDINAFEQLVEKYQKLIFSHAFRMMCNNEDASDMTQDALVKAYTNITNFRLDSKFSTWLFRIVHNLCLDELRRRKKVVFIPEESLSEHVSKAPSPQETCEKNELQQAILDGLNKLSPAHREVILLRDVNGYSYEDIALICNCSIGTVKSRINRGRQDLKSILIKSGTKDLNPASKVMKEVE